MMKFIDVKCAMCRKPLARAHESSFYLCSDACSEAYWKLAATPTSEGNRAQRRADKKGKSR